jgi:hypothetical protein
MGDENLVDRIFNLPGNAVVGWVTEHQPGLAGSLGWQGGGADGGAAMVISLVVWLLAASLIGLAFPQVRERMFPERRRRPSR